MNEALTAIIPMLAFMLIPVWIPVAAVAFGGLADRLRPRKLSPAAQRVEAIRARQLAQAGAHRAAPAAVLVARHVVELDDPREAA